MRSAFCLYDRSFFRGQTFVFIVRNDAGCVLTFHLWPPFLENLTEILICSSRSHCFSEIRKLIVDQDKRTILRRYKGKGNLNAVHRKPQKLPCHRSIRPRFLPYMVFSFVCTTPRKHIITFDTSSPPWLNFGKFWLYEGWRIVKRVSNQRCRSSALISRIFTSNANNFHRGLSRKLGLLPFFALRPFCDE